MKLFWVAIVGASLVHGTGEAADPPLAFVRHDRPAGPFGQTTQGMGAGDVDGDGRPDLVVGGDEHLLVYRNPTFAASLIADGYKFGGGAAVAVRDVSRDGRLDVVAGRGWYRNTGGTPPAWQRVALTTLRDEADPRFDD
jgi:hypothetical protein